ncbi:MAG: hotdog fold thioesterase [Weeksellaceae bacterium]|nr:hotdog fold thioesterase [Weeksellaceae bacterium]
MNMIDKLNALNKDTLMETLGITYTHFDGDMLRGEMQVTPAVHQPFGLLHGGATAVLAETLGSFLSSMQYDPKDNKMAVGTNLNVYHLKSVRSGKVTADASFVRKGRSMHVLHIDVYNEEDDKIAYAVLTTQIVERKE